MTEARTTPRTLTTAAVVVPGTAMIAVTFG